MINSIQKRLFELKDDKYGDFEAKLNPELNRDCFIGVRTPVLRKLAKEIGIDNKFLDSLPHKYFEENQLHSFMISHIKDYQEVIKRINEFLPYVDNWATSDQLDNKVFKNNKDKLLIEIKKWIKSKDTYTVRFSIGMLMSYYLDEDFDEKYLKMVASVKSNEYYINMMRAWYFATALSKQYEKTLPFITEYKLDEWTHNKTIRKAIESFRISDKQKDSLRTFAIK